MRSHLAFPLHPTDGIVVYEGPARDVTDQTAFVDYSDAFYTVFVIDGGAPRSSGAIVYVRDSRAISLVPMFTPGVPRVPAVTTTSPATTTPVESISAIKSSNITITQSSQVDSFGVTELQLQSRRPFTVSVPAAALADQFFQMVVVTLTDPADPSRSFSFLLRHDPNQSLYSATIAQSFNRPVDHHYRRVWL